MNRVPTTLQKKTGYRYQPNSRGWKHAQWAKEVKARASICAWSHLGGCAGPLEADHIIPIELGGTYSLANGRALCRHHNRTRRRPKLKMKVQK